MPATKTRVRSPFQANDDFGSIIVVKSGLPLSEDDKSAYVKRESVEYVNAEGTIAVISRYRGYSIVMRSNLALTDVVTADSEYLTSTETYYSDLRGRGVFVEVNDHNSNKTGARKTAEAMLALVQDVNDPLAVSLDGKHAPALTIARAKWEAKDEYYQDRARRSALGDLADAAGVLLDLLTLAVKEDRLVWSTPPVAPKQVLVVVEETVSGNLSERLVDEIILATREVENLGRIVHQGGVSDYLVVRRERLQKHSVREILQYREQVKKALEEIQNQAAGLLANLDKGEVLSRGFHDTLRLGDRVEQAQQAASAYAAACLHADLPDEYALALRKDGFSDKEERYRYLGSDTRAAMEALAALNGMSLKDNDY